MISRAQHRNCHGFEIYGMTGFTGKMCTAFFVGWQHFLFGLVRFHFIGKTGDLEALNVCFGRPCFRISIFDLLQQK